MFKMKFPFPSEKTETDSDAMTPVMVKVEKIRENKKQHRKWYQRCPKMGKNVLNGKEWENWERMGKNVLKNTQLEGLPIYYIPNLWRLFHHLLHVITLSIVSPIITNSLKKKLLAVIT